MASVPVVVLELDESFVSVLEVEECERMCEREVDGVEEEDSGVSAMGSSLGVGMGVMSVDGVTSTSSASRYHFRRRV